MAAPCKKRAIAGKNEEIDERSSDEDQNYDMEGSDIGKEEEEVVYQEINVDFEARTATDSDFHGIKKLLQQVFLKANVNTSELTDTIIGQNYVGSVIKQCGISDDDEMDPDIDDDEDEDEVYGVISVLNMTEKKELACLRNIRKLLDDRCKNCAAKTFDQFHQIMEEKQVGYLLSERFINIPAQLAPPMYTSLRDEMKKAVGERMKFDFDYYLLIAKTYQTKRENRGELKELQRFFINTEEEVFYNSSALSFEYDVTAEKDTVVGGEWDDETEEFDLYRTVILVEKTEFDRCLLQIREIHT